MRFSKADTNVAKKCAASFHFWDGTRGQQVKKKIGYTFTKPHSDTSRKTIISIFTAVRTPYLTVQS
jgi:hypothetical protein